jgi:hypothetical protein
MCAESMVLPPVFINGSDDSNSKIGSPFYFLNHFFIFNNFGDLVYYVD